MRHDDERCDDSAADGARVAEGRARLQARLAQEAERMRRRSRWRPARWAAVPTAAAVVLAAAWLIPSRERPHRGVAVEADALPVATLTPGATIEIAIGDVCAAGPEQPPEVDAAVRVAVLRSYGMEDVPPDEYELDYLITPQLGGAPDARNLWPQRYRERVWNAGVKDQLEDLLPRLVCDGRVDLRTAQRDIAADWVAAYRKYFQTAAPLPRPPALLGLLAGNLRPSANQIGYHNRLLWWRFDRLPRRTIRMS